VLVAAAVTVALTSCGGEDEAALPAPPPPRTTAEASAGPTIEEQPAIRGRAPTRRDLVGLWAKVGESLVWRFGADGTFVFDRSDLANPYARGTWTPHGRTITLRTLGPRCVDRWRWRAGILKASDPLDDELDVVFVGEACGVLSGAKWTLARIEG
jgi:hypothetical protein